MASFCRQQVQEHFGHDFISSQRHSPSPFWREEVLTVDLYLHVRFDLVLDGAKCGLTGALHDGLVLLAASDRNCFLNQLTQTLKK